MLGPAQLSDGQLDCASINREHPPVSGAVPSVHLVEGRATEHPHRQIQPEGRLGPDLKSVQLSASVRFGHSAGAPAPSAQCFVFLQQSFGWCPDSCPKKLQRPANGTRGARPHPICQAPYREELSPAGRSRYPSSFKSRTVLPPSIIRFSASGISIASIAPIVRA